MRNEPFAPEIEAYSQWMRLQGKSEATVGNNAGYCRSFVRFGTGNIAGFSLAGINEATLVAFAEHMRAKGFRRSTISSEVGGAIAWCRWLKASHKIKDGQINESVKASSIVDSVMGGPSGAVLRATL
jgi:hypothetical protein